MKKRFRLAVKNDPDFAGKVVIVIGDIKKDYMSVYNENGYLDDIETELVIDNEAWVECPESTIPHSFIFNGDHFFYQGKMEGNNLSEGYYYKAINKENVEKIIVLEKDSWISQENNTLYIVKSLITKLGEIFFLGDKVRYEKEETIFKIKSFTFSLSKGWYINDHNTAGYPANLTTLERYYSKESLLEELLDIVDKRAEKEMIENLDILSIKDIAKIYMVSEEEKETFRKLIVNKLNKIKKNGKV